MKSKLVRMTRASSKTLARNTWATYEAMLRTCVEGLTDVHSFKLEVLGALRNRDVDSLLDIADSISSQKYNDATSHFVANQVACLIKKYPFDASMGSFKPRDAAKVKFLESETACRRTNEYFRSVHDLDTAVLPQFHQMRLFIQNALGEFPDKTSWYELCDFSPGASIGVGGKATNIYRKLTGRWTSSPGALLYGFAAFSHDWNLMRHYVPHHGTDELLELDPVVMRSQFLERCDVHNNNKIAFVPKTTRTDRTIAVEPFINSYLQKGIDQLMRIRLKRIGIDLSSQDANTYMAYLGSLWDDDNSFVTIDLSSASDSVSLELCRNLLPPDWFDVLNHTRSIEYLLDGARERYEKFCSMGNGFCFPLETLLFTAACVACGCDSPGRNFMVYGDDIIVRKRYAHDVIKLLDVMGFKVNERKTFISGPFRESCGRDWFEGKDVRPFVLDFALDSPESVFKFLNLSKRNELTKSFFTGCEAQILALLPVELHFLRPYKGPEDSGIDAELDVFQSSPYAKWSRDLQAWTWLELHHTPKADRYDVIDGVHALTLAVIRGASAERPFTLRRKTSTSIIRTPSKASTAVKATKWRPVKCFDLVAWAGL